MDRDELVFARTRGVLNGRVSISTLAHALDEQSKLLLICHASPDGDALASLLVARRLLQRLGKDVVCFCPDREIPDELAAPLDLSPIVFELPADLDERAVLALDCPQSSNLGAAALPISERAPLLLALDHHLASHTDFALATCVVDASSTCELLYELSLEFGLGLDRATAEELYIGIVSDTGQFAYRSTTPGAHRAAAACLAAGVEPAAFAARLTGFSLSSARLLALVLERAELHAAGGLVISELTAEDFVACGAEGGISQAKPLANELRRISGSELYALIVDAPGGEQGRWVILRSFLPAEELNLQELLAGLHPYGQTAGAASYQCGDQPGETIAVILADRLIRQRDR